ncbi:hypothetical protein AXF24_13140 [Streptococcus pneumoniae]|nr:hypothetical protein AWW74_13150 [Streptococcus pneumoniae]KXB96256.1 hypothetical protein AXF24_13140 [Streptococcus pneumoniae]
MRDGESVLSGAKQSLTNGHLFSRQSYSTRWDITPDGNCHCQTMGENMSHEYDPYPYTRWYIEKFGIEKYDELHRRHKQVSKLKDADLELMIVGVQEAITLLKENEYLRLAGVV